MITKYLNKDFDEYKKKFKQSLNYDERITYFLWEILEVLFYLAKNQHEKLQKDETPMEIFEARVLDVIERNLQ